MSKQFKPLYVQVAEKLSAQLKEATSPIQKPVKDNGKPAFVAPINAVSGKGYSALNALNLSMKGHDDPRWLSAKDAGYAGYLVKEGSKGTLINFPKNNEIQAMRTPDGEKIKDENGQTQTKVVEFEKTQNGKAFLFNATQIDDMPPLEEFLAKQQEAQPLSPNEQAEKMITDSKAIIIHGGPEAYYDQKKDEIHLPEKAAFENDTKYYQAAIHQLAHWSGHESRLNRPMGGNFGSMEYGREELRAALAAMLIGGELKTGNSFGNHAAYSGNWAKTLKDQPFEITRAANDAQKIARMLLTIGEKREVKQSTAPNMTLAKGEEIAYNNTTYKIEDKKGKTLSVVKEDTGQKIKVKPTDKLYDKLVEARNNPPAAQLELAETEQQTHKIGR